MSLAKFARMQVAPVFEKSFSSIYGRPCWQVEEGVGSFLTLEFGKPHLEVREPITASKRFGATVQESLARRNVVVHGDWHLWIYCCEWEVLFRNRRIGDSSTKTRVRRAAEFLDGQVLTRFSISPRTVECAFFFDLGGTLKTRPYDRECEQWLLYEPRHKVLTLRGDGQYKYVRSDTPEDRGAWHPIAPHS